MPPKERIQDGKLSISREVLPISAEQTKTSILENTQSNLLGKVSKDANSLLLSNTKDIPSTINQSRVETYNNARKEFIEANNPSEKLRTLQLFKDQNQELDNARKSFMTIENMNDPAYGKLEK